MILEEEDNISSSSTSSTSSAAATGPIIKTIGIIAHGSYDVTPEGYIRTTVLPYDPCIESVVISSGFPGTFIRTNIISSVSTIMKDINKRHTSELITAFPPLDVTEAGVMSPLLDDGSEVIELLKEKDVYILVNKEDMADTETGIRTFGKSLQEYYRANGTIPHEVNTDRGMLTALNVSAYVPGDYITKPRTATRTLKLKLSRYPVGTFDPSAPLIGVWDLEHFSIDTITWLAKDESARLSDYQKHAFAAPSAIFGGTEFGTIDEVIDRIVKYHNTQTYSPPIRLRIVFMACGVLSTSSGDQELLKTKAPQALFNAPSASSENIGMATNTNVVRLITFSTMGQLTELMKDTYLRRNGVKKGGRRRNVRKNRTKKTRKAPRSSQKGRSRRRRSAASTSRERR
jgi:hypothetical protein